MATLEAAHEPGQQDWAKAELARWGVTEDEAGDELLRREKVAKQLQADLMNSSGLDQ